MCNSFFAIFAVQNRDTCRKTNYLYKQYRYCLLTPYSGLAYGVLCNNEEGVIYVYAAEVSQYNVAHPYI